MSSCVRREEGRRNKEKEGREEGSEMTWRERSKKNTQEGGEQTYSCKCLGEILLTFRSFEAFPANSSISAAMYSITAATYTGAAVKTKRKKTFECNGKMRAVHFYSLTAFSRKGQFCLLF